MITRQQTRKYLSIFVGFALTLCAGIFLGINAVIFTIVSERDQQIELLKEMLEKQVIENIQESISIKEVYLPTTQSI